MKGNLTKDILSKYISPVFFETGTYEGHSVAVALEVGFSEIYSIEICKPFYENCVNKFSKDKNVHLFLGDSASCLEDAIADINKRITFWLDGHNIGKIPIIEELKSISKHPIKNHIILVDDRRVMGTVIWSYISEQDVIKSILKINPNYKISYENSLNAPNDILVATLEE